MRVARLFACTTALLAVTASYFGVLPARLAHAQPSYGNYTLAIPDRYDFHTWIWVITACREACVTVSGIPQPVARAFEYSAPAHLTDNRYTLNVDIPDGLRCGNIYYGSTVPTHDVYDWDATSLTGTLISHFDAGCDGRPGALSYPFSLHRL